MDRHTFPRHFVGSSSQPLPGVHENNASSHHIAVVGMAGRFPGCESVGELWELLQQRKDVHEEIPRTRFNIEEHYDATGKKKNTTLTRYGCFLDKPGLFDNRFFNISPREAAQMDPLQRLFLTTTYEAIEMAGYSPDHPGIDRSRIATYFGQSTDDWKTINEQQGIQPHYLPSTNRCFAPGRVSHHFKWGGGHYSIDTGCSSSATAIHLACNALLSGESDMCVVGGGNICVIPEYFSGFSLGSFLSPTGGCKTFSEAADGYCRGEAVGTVIIKRLDDAVAANDNILGVIAATARNSNTGKDSITYPSEVAQQKLLEQLLTTAGANANEIGFVEMHGTGTQAGDWVEMNSVRKVLAQSRDLPLQVGALKANIGHGEAAAGISSLIKALLTLRYDAISGQPGPLVLNHRFSGLDKTEIVIARETRSSIPRSVIDGKRKIIVNSFDAAGGNTSLLLQDGPERTKQKSDPRTHHLVAISAVNPQSLKWNRERLRKYLEQHEADLADLGYTTAARRIHHPHREAYVVDSTEQLINRLKKSSQALPSHEAKSLIFIFTGQSSQYTAMGGTLYNTSPRFQKTLDEYDSYCTSSGFGSIIEVINGTIDIAAASPSQVQLATVALEIALARFLQDVGLKPTVVIGHSLGEFSSLCVAGVLSVTDALSLVYKRAALLKKHCVVGSWGMMAVPLSSAEVESLLQEAASLCEICCLNGPSDTVIGGPSDMIQRFQEVLASKGLSSTRLKVPYAFHTSQMDSIVSKFKRIIDSVHFGEPSIPMVSTLTGGVVASAGTFSSSYLVQQCRQQVDFVGALKTCEAEGLILDGTMVVEIGPHPVCISFLAQSLPDLQLGTFPTLQRGRSDWEIISECLAAAYVRQQPVDWGVFHKDYIRCLSLVDLPSYAFDSKDYWTAYKTQAVTSTLRDNPSQAASRYSTSTLQVVDFISADRSTATFFSHVREPSLLSAIHGHLVDGVAICPASIFIDMACGAAQALLEQSASRSEAMEVTDLKMIYPLVVSDSDAEQKIRIEAKREAKSSSVMIRISSTLHGTFTEHASCRVMIHLDTTSRRSRWPQVQRLVQSRVDTLSSFPSGELCHRMAKGILYKLFDGIVEYSDPFRLLENITVDGTFQDAAAEIRTLVVTDQGSFSLDPFTVDALIHLPGFLLNCNLEKPKTDIYIAKSIGRVLVLDAIQAGIRPLTCYASVTGQGDDGSTLCDVYLFSKGVLAALVERICFQKITRRILKLITGGSNVLSPSRDLVQTTSLNAATSSDTDTLSLVNEDLFSIIVRTVAEETGFSTEEVKSATSFAALGVDSHMGISIIAEINRITGTAMPAAFFNNCPTLAAAERALKTENNSRTLADNLSRSNGSNNQKQLVERREQTQASQPSETIGRAILLQGDPDSKEPPLFLVTESSGSVAVYIYFPALPFGTPIYAIESPFLSCPERNNLSVPELSGIYIETMRTVQPAGPYLLGGYSFAAVYAYEMAYQLSLMGERLTGIIIVDMYVPPPAPPVSQGRIELGMQRFSLDGIRTGPLANITNRISAMFPRFTDEQKVHMAGSMRAAAVYTPLPIPKGLGPVQTHLIWAARGVNENGKEEEYDGELEGPAWMGVCEPDRPWSSLSDVERSLLLRSWFFAPRETFGSNGWERLVGDDIVIHKVDADHLSLVAPPKVQELGQVIAQAVGSCTRAATTAINSWMPEVAGNGSLAQWSR
ncbi:hypothetical protein BDV06DRAFT_221967 [Aspergillus oleicola]